jgi:hypothetical protein
MSGSGEPYCHLASSRSDRKSVFSSFARNWTSFESGTEMVYSLIEGIGWLWSYLQNC